MDEFKKVPNAQAYEVNTQTEIRKVVDKKPVILSKDGKALLKKDDGGWEYFVPIDLVKELFGNDKDYVVEHDGMRYNPLNPKETLEYTKEQPPIVVQEGGEIKVEATPSKPLEMPIAYVESSLDEKEKEFVVEIGSEPYKEPNKSTLKALKTLQKKLKVPVDGISGLHIESASKGKIDEILKKDCSESIKVWKLHQIGCSTDEILEHLKQPKKKGHSFTSIVWGYKQNKKRRDRADSK